MVADGSLRFTDVLLTDREFGTDDAVLTVPVAAGRAVDLEIAPGQAAFTVCQVPVVLHAGGADPVIRVTEADGRERELTGLTLDRATSKQIFDRSGVVSRLDVFMARAYHLTSARGGATRTRRP